MYVQGTSNAFDAITVRIYTCKVVYYLKCSSGFCERAHISVVNKFFDSLIKEMGNSRLELYSYSHFRPNSHANPFTTSLFQVVCPYSIGRHGKLYFQ